MKSNQLNNTSRNGSPEFISTALQGLSQQHRLDKTNHNLNTNQSGMNKMYNTLRTGKFAVAFLMAMAFTFFNLQKLTAQVTVSGAITGNGSYATLSTAFTNIGVSQSGASIIIDITADVTQNATATLGAGNWTSVLIRPSGGATRTISGAVTAGNPMIDLSGADNVTIDGLNTGSNALIISNTTASPTTGTSTIRLVNDATNNTITRCTIRSAFNSTTVTTNGGCIWFSTTTGSTGNDNNTVSNCNLTAVTAGALTKCIANSGSTSSLAIMNSGNTITNNNIYDYFVAGGGSAGIQLNGGNTSWTITNNRIYQTATRTQTTASTNYGIYILGSAFTEGGYTITGNTIGYTNGTARTGTTTYNGAVAPSVAGINFTQSPTGANSTLSQNHISNISIAHTAGTGATFVGIVNGTSSTSQTETITFNQDTVQNISMAIGTGTFYGLNTGSAATLNVTNNYIYNLSRTAAGIFYGINCAGTVGSLGQVTNNTIDSIYGNNATYTSTVAGLFNSAAVPTISNNTITRIRTAGTTTGTIYGLYLSGTVNRVAKNNSITNINQAGTGTVYGIYKIGSGTLDSISNNTVTTLRTAGAGTIGGIYIGSATTQVYVTGNNVYDINTASATIDGIRSTTGVVDIANNNVYNITGTNASPLFAGIQVSGGTTQSIYNNTVYNLSATGATSPLLDGIKIGGATTNNCYQNTVYGLTNTSGATAPFTVGIEYVGAGGTYNIYRNKVYDITCSGTAATTYGIGTGSSFTGTTVNIYNNVIGDIKAPQSTGLNAVIGINIRAASATQTHRVYFNTVHLNATSTSATTFGTSCVTFPAGITLSSGAGLDLRNNILINNSTPAQDGSADANNGIAACVRMQAIGTNGAVPSFYATTSDKNNFWCNPAAGTANHVVYCEGLDASATNSYNGIAGYKGWVANRDQFSFADNLGSNTSPTSMNLTTTSGTYLKIAASTTTQCEAGASIIGTPSITDDYSGATGNRSTTPDVGAYEFSGITPAPSISFNSATPSLAPACTAASRLISVDVTVPTGTVTGVTLTYTFNGSGGLSNQAMTNTTGNTWTYTIPAASSPANATIAWSILATGSTSLTTSYSGTSYADEPLTGVTATATTPSTTICSRDSITLTAVLTKAKTDSLGTGGSSSSASGGSFLPGSWGGNKTQYIVRASELQALGFTAGNFTSLGFRPTNAGDTYEGFALSIGQTSQTTMTNTTMISSGLTQVYKGTTGPDQGFLPVANTLNTLAFGTGSGSSSSFAWNGTSNLVISICWSSVPAAGTSTSTTILGDILGYSCTGSGQSDNLTPAAMCALTTGFGTSTSGTFRPKFIFAGNASPAISSVSWVANPGATSLGTGNPLTTVQTNTPSGTSDSVRTYVATITASGCTILDTTNSVTVKSSPTIPNGDGTLLTQCGTPTYTVTSGATSPTYKFYTAPTGGSSLTVGNTSGIYAYTAAIADQTNTLYVSVTDGITGCESDRLQIDVYVNAPDPFTIYHSGAVNSCIDRIDTLFATSTLANYETYTWAPTTNLYTNAAGTTPYTGTNRDTVYYKRSSITTGEKITASASNATTTCSAIDTVRFVVNANPLVTAATATPSAVCSGSTVALNGQSIPASAGTATVGAGATSTSTYNAPFYSLWSNKHMQILIKQAELVSAGLTTGNITGIKFPTTAGTVSNKDYTLKLKASTGVSDMSAFVSSGFTTVYTAAAVPQTASTDNEITFSTPFAWDGTSDLIVEMCWGDNTTTATLSSTSPADNTSYVSVIKTHVTVATAGSTICTDYTTNILTYSVRPQIKFVGQIGTNQTSSYTWTWSTTGVLGATVASGSATTNAPTNVATYPNTASLTYTAKATNASTGCYGSLAASAVAVNALPPAPTSTSATPQCGAPTYAASTTVTGSPTFKWYSLSTGGTLLQSNTSNSYVQASGFTAGGATNSVWVSVTDANGCEGPRTQCDVVVNTPPSLSISPAGITNTCVNAITQMRVTSTLGDFDSYEWTPQTNLFTDAGASSGYVGGSEDTVYFKRATTGTTIVYTLTATNSGTGCSAIVRDTFNVNANPVVLVATATPAAVCNGSSVSLNGSVQSATGTYTAPPAVTNPTIDEDLGSVVITATIGGATVLSNATAVNSLVGTIGTATGTAGGYSNFTGFGPYTLNRNTSYDFAIGTVQTDTDFGNSCAIYIDYNRDGDFADAGELVYAAGATTSGVHTETGSFTVPGTASVGPCRMRIINHEGVISSPTTTVAYGEYEEYAIYISDGVNYTWSWSNGFNTVASSSIATVASSNSGVMDSSVVYTATATNTTTGCFGSLAATAITVHPSPAAPTDNNTDSTQCGTPTYLATGAAYNGSYRWYTVSTGGTAISGATGASYSYTGYSIANAPAITQNTLYVSIVDSFGCEGARTAIFVNVAVPPTLTISPNGADSSCVNRVRTINVTSTVGDFDSYIWSPNTNLYTNSDGTGAYAGTSRDTVYYKRTTTTSSAESFILTATNTGTGCVNTAVVSFIVRANPVVTSAIATTSPVCAGGTVNLAALSIPAVSDTGTIITGAATTISGNTGVPYRTSAGATSLRTQYLVRASELIARGFTTGNITSLGFTLTGTTTGALSAMTIGMATTTDTVLTTTPSTVTFTSVANVGAYTPVTGLNSHTFSTAFYWNGTSNIIIEMCQTISTTGGATVVASTPGFIGTSQTTGVSACAATTTTTSASRPAIIFGGQIGVNQTSALTWAWTSSNQSGDVATGSTTTATAYNPSTTNTAATVTYTATGTNASGCTASLAATAITVNAAPNAPSNTSVATQCGTPTFSVSSNSGLGSPTYRWYTVATGGTAISGATSSTYVLTSYVVGVNTLYASEVNGSTGCEGARVQCDVTTSNPPALDATANVTTCVSNGNAIMLTATVGLDSFTTFTWSPTTNLFTDAALTNAYTSGNEDTVYVNGGVVTAGRTYTLVASGGGCTNNDSTVVIVNSIPTISTQPVATAVCGTGNTNIFAYSSGTNTTKQWKMSANGTSGWTNVADSTPSAASGSAYYTGKTSDTLFINRLSANYYYQLVVSNTGCTAATSSAVLVNAGTPTVTTYDSAIRCGTGAVTLSATPSAGALIRWYSAATGGTALATSTTPGAVSTYTPSVSSTTNYYAEPVVLGAVTPNNLGRDTTVIPAATGLSSERGIIFRCTKSGVINSAYVYTTVTGTLTPTIRLTDSATNTTIGSSFTSPITSTGAGWYKMDNLNIAITAGNSYRLLAAWSGGSVSGYTTGVDYTSSAWNSLGAYGTVRAGSDVGTVSSTGYWYFSGISISDFTACTNTRQRVSATVTTPPTVTIAPATSTICAGSSATLTASSSNDPNYRYTWTASAVTVGTGAVLNVTPSATTTYVVTAVDTTGGVNAGCNLTTSRSVTVNPKPTSINPSNNAGGTICNGTAVNLSVTASAGTGASISGYAWTSSPAGYTSATQNPTGVTPSVTTTYQVKVTNTPFNCTDSNTTTVTVYPIVSAAVSGTTAICPGDSTNVTVTFTGVAPWSYTYNNGTNHTVSVSSSPYTLRVAPAATTTYTSVSVTDNNNCSALGGGMTGSAVITVNAAPTASITGSSTYCPTPGTTLTAIASAGSGTITGYQWKLNGSNISGQTDSFTIAATTGSYTVVVTNSNGCTTTSAAHALSVAQYTITASAGSNGSITPSGVTTKNCETSQAYTFTPSSCYQVDSVFVNGSYVDSTVSYTFNNITANHTISVSFKLIPYTITLSPGANGSISGSTSVNCGANSTYTITADACHTITDVTVDGTSVGAVTSYQLVNVTAPHTIVATFAAITYTITSSAGTNGSISPNGVSTVNCGDDSTFTITPNSGYGILDVLVDGVTNAGAISTGTYTFTNLAANHTITASFYDTLCPNPPTGSAGANATICAGTNYTLGGSIGGGATSATWSTSGTGTFDGSGVFGTATAYTPSGADITAGFVTITLTTDNPGGSCTPAVSNLTLTLKALATAGISGADTVCSGTGTTVSFSGSPNAVITYTVNGGSNQTITLNSGGTASLNTGNLTTTTTYALVSVATGGSPNCSSSASGSVVVTVNSLPTASASPVAANVCNNTSTSINFTGTANATVTYNINGGSDLTITLDGSGNGSVSTGNLTANATYNLTSIQDNGTPNCSNTLSSSTSVTVIANPTGGISGTATICTGDSTNISFTGTANATVTYTINGGSNLSVVLNGSGNATVNTSVLTADATYALVSVATAGSPSCSVSASGSAVVTVSTPSISITSACGTPINVLTGNTYSFSANVGGGSGTITTYQWKRDGSNVGANSPNLTNQSAVGSYTLTITNSTGCSVTSAPVVMSVAALNGTYTIGSSGCNNFTSFANAFSHLNVNGVTGTGATFNVVSAYTETAPSGGLSLGSAILDSSSFAATVTKPIVFQKASGTNPLITASNANTAGFILDAVIKVIGVDYVTFDAIDVRENAGNSITTLASNSMTEFGYALMNRDSSNGAKNNTIQNCTITMNKTYQNSFGIYSNTRHKALNAATTSLYGATTNGGTNSRNKIYSNTITNVNMPIVFVGFAVSSNMDTLNEIGGSGLGNTITNWGSNTGNNAGHNSVTTTMAGIYLNNQKAYTVSNNNLSNATAIAITTYRGILTDYTSVSPDAGNTFTNNINNNTIALNSNNTSGTFNCIATANTATTIATTGSTLNINNNNLIGNVISGAASSSVMVGITNAYTPGTLNMNNNVFRSNTSTATTGGMTAFQNTGAVVNTINIQNNQIGNATGGAITYSAATSGATAGISNTGGAATARAYILGNDFRGITHTVAGSSAHTYIANTATVLSDSICGNTFTTLSVRTTGSVTMISNGHALPASGMQTVKNNSIVTSFAKTSIGGTITGYAAATSHTAGAIVTHQNNNFSNITDTGSASIVGWSVTDLGAATKTITNNTFNNWTNITPNGTAGGTAIGMTLNGFGGVSTVNTNTVTNITGAHTATTGIIIGATGVGTALSVNANTITNLASTLTTATGTVLGMSVASPVTLASVYSNAINTLSTTATTTASVIGMTLTGTTVKAYKNKIYDLSGTQAAATITGINITAGTTDTVYNNLIGDLRATTATGTAAINGIAVSGGTTINLFNNSVLLSATGGTTFGSSALYVSSTTPTVVARNNNFVNLSTPGSTSGASAGLRYVSAPGAKYSTASNNNNYNAGTAAANRLIYVEGTTTLANGQQTIAAYKAYIGSKDGASTTENPTYVSTAGANSNFLNIDAMASTTLESGGGSISGITDDYAGNTRNVSTPDIGAWEFTGTLNDIIAPAIGTPIVAAPCNSATFTVTSVISDATGVPTVGATVPRVYYYKKYATANINTAWYSAAGSLTSGTAQSGTWTFTITAADMSGVAVGDSIGYYIIAQDSATGNNLTANPSAGLVATNVNTVSTPPTTPLLFKSQGTLVGSYTVGSPTSNYTTLTAAIIDYNNSCLGGAVTFLLDSTKIQYSATAIAANSFASATNTLTIKPNTGLNVTVYSKVAAAATSVFNLAGADYVTIDGSNNGTNSKNLTITDSSTAATYATVLLSSLGTSAGATNNTIKNCIINGGLNTNAGSYGISIGGATAGTGGADNDNNTVLNNTITKAYWGIYANGSATTNPGAMDNLSIDSNQVGAATVANYVTTYGITVGNGLTSAVTKNNIFNIVNTLTVSPEAIHVIAGFTNSSITRNRIDSVYTSNTGGYGSRGICVGTADAASNLTIANNMISQISGASNWSTFGNSSSMGIALGVTTTVLTTVTGGVNLWNNTVDMRGNFTSTTASVVTAALYVGSAASALDVRNNILSNNLVNIGAGTTPKAYAINSAAANTAFTTINNNNYYVGDGAQGVLANIAATDYSTLATLTTAFGGNAASVNAKPGFTSASDVHLVTTTNCALNGTAASIGAVTTDYDGDTRSGTPDMGADEFTSTYSLVTNPVVVCGGTGNLTAGAVTTGSVVAAGTTYTYWTDAGATASYATPAAAIAGTYFIKAQSGSCTSVQPVTVTVNTASVAATSATASDTIVCNGNSTTLTQLGGTLGTSAQWMWYSDAGLTTKVDSSSASNASVTVSPTSNTTYYVRAEGTASPCTSNSSAVNKAIAVLSVNGGYSHNWKGGTSTDWSVASNWCANSVPTSTNNVYISANALVLNQPVLSANAVSRNLEVATGASLSIGSGLDLRIYGNELRKYGNISGAGTTILDGSVAGTSSVTFYGNGSLANNVTVIDNIYAILSNDSVSINGTLNIGTGSEMNMYGTSTLTLGSSVTGAGQIHTVHSGTKVVLTGPATVPTQLGSSVTNLTISRAGGVAMSGNLTVSGALTQTSGKFALAGNTLTLAGSISNDTTNSLTTDSLANIVVTTGTGTAYFNQTTSADVTLKNGTNALNNLTKSGAGTFVIGNKLNLFNGLTVTGGTLDLGGSLVLRSTSTNTAYVAQVTGTITGQAIVERYMHNQQRGWRAITAPITYNGLTTTDSSNSFKRNWQSDWGYGSNYGTRVTGPNITGGASIAQRGLDDATTGSSVQTYNSTTGAWTRVTNTWTETQSGNSATAANKAFYMFIRGDRTITPANSVPGNFTPTTLASKGLLQTGTQTFNFSGTANKNWLVGNPYASPVDMESVANNNIGDFIYVWDPNMTGFTTATSGNYVTFDRTTWNAGPNAGGTTKYFQSGQAFFVFRTGTSSSLTFTEADKVSSSQNNTQVTGSANGLADIFNVKLLNVKADGTRSEVDGARAKFGANFSADVDDRDGTKWVTAGIENMSFIRNSKALVIEARPYITTTDSLFMNMVTMNSGANYEFKVNPINFDATVSSCKLVDNFLNTETPISLSTTTTVGFNVTSVAGSSAANRFYFVFNGAGSLPTTSLNVKAFKKNTSIVVDWEATTENGVKLYDVEKSTTGTDFGKIANETAINGNITNKYSFTDNNPVVGVNYYRIKATQTNNSARYSSIVRVEMTEKGIKSVTVYPNPVKGNVIGVQMNNLESGKYTAKLFNAAGQEIWTNIITHNGNGSISLQLKNALSSGTYQLQFTDAKGNNYKQSVMVVE